MIVCCKMNLIPVATYDSIKNGGRPIPPHIIEKTAIESIDQFRNNKNKIPGIAIRSSYPLANMDISGYANSVILLNV